VARPARAGSQPEGPGAPHGHDGDGGLVPVAGTNLTVGVTGFTFGGGPKLPLKETEAAIWDPDAGFNDLMRPTLYGAYHEISLIPRPGSPAVRRARPSVVAGPLCESGDVFTQDSSGNVAPAANDSADVHAA